MDAKEALEVEYTPSLFSKRFKNRDELMEKYIEFTLKGEILRKRIEIRYLKYLVNFRIGESSLPI